MDKILTITSRVISGLSFPLLMPTYAMLLAFSTTFLSFLPNRPILTVSLVTIGVTVMLPVIAIYVMHTLGIVADPLLNNRRDRSLPFVFTVFTHLGLSVYLWKIHAPQWMTAFMVGAAALIVVILFINMVWKISGHAAGMGGLTALSVFLAYRGYSVIPGVWVPCIVIILSGIVCTSRLLLNRHTLGQVAAGYALSLTIIYLSMLLSGTVS